MFRTRRIHIKPTHPAYRYFLDNTSGTRAVRNQANFYIRNTMTGIKKSPEERTLQETEVLHDVFTTIQKMNRDRALRLKKKLEDPKFKGKDPESCPELKKLIKACAPVPYPTAEKWLLSYGVLDAILKYTKNEAYYSCTSQVNQQAIKKTCQSWKGYFSARKEYRKAPGRFQAAPRIPGYIREKLSTAHFTSQVCRPVDVNGERFLHFANFGPVHVGPCSVHPGIFIKAEVRPYHGQFLLLLTYETEEEGEIDVPETAERIMGIDVGIGNFLACMDNTGERPLLIRGGWLKSRNQWFNKERARLMGCLAKGTDSRHSVKHSRALDALSRKRSDRFRDFFYKTSHRICRICKDRRIEVIVIGHNEGQKDASDMGRTNNQNFVSIPYLEFIRTLKTVASRYGIAVAVTEESYTSKASLLGQDRIPAYGAKDNACTFSGERIRRGLYRSGNGAVINADLNGAGNIARKVYPRAFSHCRSESLCRTPEVILCEDILKIKRETKTRKEHTDKKAA